MSVQCTALRAHFDSSQYQFSPLSLVCHWNQQLNDVEPSYIAHHFTKPAI